MQCPVDGTDLAMSERQGVEIDYCPKCRGVWLDRGELDKIIERAEADFDEPRPRDDDRHDPRRHERHGAPRHKKRKSLLSEFFEFGD